MTGNQRTRFVGVLLALAGAFSSPAAVSAASTAATTAPAVLALNFDDQSLNTIITNPIVRGSAADLVTASTLTLNQGKATTQAGAPGSGRSMRLPAYTRLSSASPLAVVSIRNKAGSNDPLNPGRKRFTFMADFSLDDVSSNAPSNSDGDNIFQRGISPNTQWQLSVDGHRARCAVRTAGASAQIRTPAIEIPRKTTNRSWYRAVCLRDTDAAGTLTLTVSYYDTAARTWKYLQSTRVKGTAGDLSMSRTIPLSIGGKLNNNNTIQRSAPDQFNGLVDNVRLIIG